MIYPQQSVHIPNIFADDTNIITYHPESDHLRTAIEMPCRFEQAVHSYETRINMWRTSFVKFDTNDKICGMLYVDCNKPIDEGVITWLAN